VQMLMDGCTDHRGDYHDHRRRAMTDRQPRRSEFEQWKPPGPGKGHRV
jgi:hypothetical protein